MAGNLDGSETEDRSGAGPPVCIQPREFLPASGNGYYIVIPTTPTVKAQSRQDHRERPLQLRALVLQASHLTRTDHVQCHGLAEACWFLPVARHYATGASRETVDMGAGTAADGVLHCKGGALPYSTRALWRAHRHAR